MIDKSVIEYICCPYDESELGLNNEYALCNTCKRKYKVVKGGILSIMPDEFDYDNEIGTFKKIEQEVRNKQVNDYDRWFGTYTNAIEYNNFISNLELTKFDILLDAGCGIGRYTIDYSFLCKKVIAIDYSIKSLLKLQERLKLKGINNVYLIHADLTYLPIKKSCIDKIISNQVLTFIPGSDSRKNLIKKFYDILLPNGKMILSVFNNHVYRKIKIFLGLKGVFHKEGTHPMLGFYYYNYSSNEIKLLIKQSGFKVEKIKGVCNLPREYIKDFSDKNILYKIDSFLSKTSISFLLGDLLIGIGKKE